MNDFLILINFCIILAKNGVFDKFKMFFKQFEESYRMVDSETKSQEPEVAQNYELLSNLYKALD